jgi:hypothetical protein
MAQDYRVKSAADGQQERLSIMKQRFPPYELLNIEKEGLGLNFVVPGHLFYSGFITRQGQSSMFSRAAFSSPAACRSPASRAASIPRA